MENLNAVVGKNLAALRKAKGLTQQDLAYEINYSDKSISKWELGYSCPSADILMDIASYFGVTVDYLLHPHEESEIVGEEKPKKDPTQANKALLLSMTMAAIILIALSLFFTRLYFTSEDRRPMWNVFMWMVPILLFVASFQVHRFYHKKWVTLGLLSGAIWTFFLSVCFQYYFFNETRENLWFIMTVGIPIQVILVLIANWRRAPKEGEEEEKAE